MAGHTPGPWRVIHHNSGASRVLAGPFELLLTNRTGAKADVWTANAQLIAAAPELLDAAKAFADNAVETADGNIVFGYRVLDRLRAAIAKAEGR